MNSFGDFFNRLNRGLYQDMEMRSICLNSPIKTATGVKRIVREGDIVRVEDGRLVDCGEPTHKIIGCLGNAIGTSLSLVLVSLKSSQPLTLNLSP